MDREEIIRMARNEYGIYAFTAESLAEFCSLIAADECEACAKVCEAADKSTHPADLADAIRARGNT